MKIKKGDKLDIELPTSEGNKFNLSETHGKKVLLTFYRIASCSLCNLRISQITKDGMSLDLTFNMFPFGMLHKTF